MWLSHANLYLTLAVFLGAEFHHKFFLSTSQSEAFLVVLVIEVCICPEPAIIHSKLLKEGNVPFAVCSFIHLLSVSLPCAHPCAKARIVLFIIYLYKSYE